MCQSFILASLAEKKTKKRCIKTFASLISEDEDLPLRNKINPAGNNKEKKQYFKIDVKRKSALFGV